jgi:hypothetical protein
MNIQRIHLHTNENEIICGADPNGGLLLSTHLPAMTTCGPCLTALDPAVPTHITDEEFEELMTAAFGAVSQISEAMAARAREEERWHRILLALDALYRETPWWQARTRHRIRQAMARLTPEARS